MGHGHDQHADRFGELCDHVVERCRSAGWVAPTEWVRWLLGLEVEAAARRDGVSIGQATLAMTTDHASSLADELIAVTESGSGPGDAMSAVSPADGERRRADLG